MPAVVTLCSTPRIERKRCGKGPGGRLYEQRYVEIRGDQVRQSISIHVGYYDLRGAGAVEDQRRVEGAGARLVIEEYAERSIIVAG